MSALTKTEISRAVTAIRDLAEIIERIEKASWPETQNDVLRKADGLHPRASASQLLAKRVAEAETIAKRQDDMASALLAQLADLNASLDRLEAGGA